MNGTALYRALVEASASEERTREAAESVVHLPEAATRSDIAGVNANIAGVRTEIAEMETRLERSLREMSVRFLTLLIAFPGGALRGAAADRRLNPQESGPERDFRCGSRIREAQSDLAWFRDGTDATARGSALHRGASRPGKGKSRSGPPRSRISGSTGSRPSFARFCGPGGGAGRAFSGSNLYHFCNTVIFFSQGVACHPKWC